MKVLVSFKPNKKNDHFEGARLRKSIKGALELNSIQHTDSGIDYFDVAHIISPEQEGEMNDYHNNGAPVVVSALYCEDDPKASYTYYDDVDKKACLKQKALKFLNKADLVLVPTESARDFLIKEKVTSIIKVLPLGVNVSRFDFSKTVEKEIFYRYYREDSRKKLVIGVGEYESDMKGINAFIDAAKKSPNAIFYYFGIFSKLANLNIRFKKIINKAPSNVKFVEVPPDDIYRSALLNAEVFMVPGYKYVGVTTLKEAMSAKCQIIARRSAVLEGLLEDGVTAHLADFSETISSLTRDYLDGKIKPTITQAYQQVSLYTLSEFGVDLNSLYQIAIKDNVNRRL